MFYVYILQRIKDSQLYRGFINNFRKGILKHNLDKVFSTKIDKRFIKKTG